MLILPLYCAELARAMRQVDPHESEQSSVWSDIRLAGILSDLGRTLASVWDSVEL